MGDIGQPLKHIEFEEIPNTAAPVEPAYAPQPAAEPEPATT